MVYFAAGWKPGFGPVVKVMKNDDDDFLTTPNTQYERFLFNSETQNLSYMFDKYYFSTGFDVNVYAPGSSSAQGNTYSLDGGPVSSCRRGMSVVPVQFSSTQIYWNYNEIFPRFDDYSGVVPIFEVKLIDANDQVDLFRFDGAPGNTRLYSTGFSYGGVTTNVTPSSGTPIHANIPYDKIHPSFNYSGWVGKASNAPTPLTVTVVLDRGDNRRFLSCQWDLPAQMNVPLPVPSGTITEGQEVLRIAPGRAAMARAGFDVNATNRRAYLFDSNHQPMQCVIMGETPFVAPGNTYRHENTSGVTLHPTMFLDAILRYQGRNYSIPPVDPNVSRSGNTCVFRYKIDATGVTFYNEGNYTVSAKFLVFATSVEGNTSGGTAVMRSLPSGDVQIKRPGSSDTAPNANDILLDTRFPSLRILSEGTVPISSFSTANRLDELFGTHAAIVPYGGSATLSNMFVFPKVVGNWPNFIAQGYYRSLRPPNVVQWRTSNYCMTTVLRETDMVIHLSPGAPTDVRADTGFQYSMPDPLGVRYYVLGATYR